MTIFGAGAHEAGHIVLYWLTEKYNDENIAYHLLIRAWLQAIRTEEGKGKLPRQLRKEISIHSRKENFSECIADAVSDYLTNREKSAVLSREIWKLLKGASNDMLLAYGQSKLSKFSDEEFEKYGVFDEVDDIVGVKEDAPPEFKEAYEADKKMREELRAQGFDA